MRPLNKAEWRLRYKQNENWHLVPSHLRGTLHRYLERGVPPGHFMTAVLENNLMEAMGRADAESLAGLENLCKFIYCDTPGLCHGSPAHVAQWIKWGGWEGIETDEAKGGQP